MLHYFFDDYEPANVIPDIPRYCLARLFGGSYEKVTRGLTNLFRDGGLGFDTGFMGRWDEDAFEDLNIKEKYEGYACVDTSYFEIEEYQYVIVSDEVMISYMAICLAAKVWRGHFNEKQAYTISKEFGIPFSGNIFENK